MWRVAETAWLYVVVDTDRAGNGLVALSVADLDAAMDELSSRGIHPDRLEEVGGGARRRCPTPTETPSPSFRCLPEDLLDRARTYAVTASSVELGLWLH